MCYGIKTLLTIDLCRHGHRKRNCACISTKKFAFWFEYLCRMSSLAAVREALVISFNIIDEVEFALLYDQAIGTICFNDDYEM